MCALPKVQIIHAHTGKTNYTLYQECTSRIVLMEAITHLYVFLEARWLSRWFHFKEKTCKINLCCQPSINMDKQIL